MISKRLKIAVFSDVHLGHRKTPTVEIIRALKIAVPDKTETSDLDMIFIPGDFFDRFLNLPNDDVFEIHSYIGWLLRMCKRRDIVLRVLEGTPSHDWRQSRLVESINENAGIDADAKHVPELSIEYIERFGINILYIPDEWSSDNDDTYQQVVKQLSEHGLAQVDFTLMHGCFPYQLPAHVQVPTHDPDRYADITKHYVLCGHVHKPSRYRNIIVPGSFDRLAHNEEEAKGHWRLEVTQNGEADQITFVENEGAKLYRTLNCTGMSQDDVLDAVEHQVRDVPNGSHLRIAATADDPAAASLDVLRRKYPMFQWTSKIESTVRMGRDTLTDLRATFQTTPITKKSIAPMIEERLKEMSVEQDEVRRALEALKEVI